MQDSFVYGQLYLQDSFADGQLYLLDSFADGQLYPAGQLYRRAAFLTGQLCRRAAFPTGQPRLQDSPACPNPFKPNSIIANLRRSIPVTLRHPRSFSSRSTMIFNAL
ncbi:hypothetical protein [Gordoniibacillus kamchatkensis]|uniref:hypothetical protein n=1 Tax=Gordoniibacillus kamchatkensis TaxID=1590651 RepID=UPI0012E029D7|nr:hypothetical protein [Paenibacillus sp. VKM B-2647]